MEEKQENNKSEELEIVEIVQTITPQDTYFVFDANGKHGYMGVLAYWIFAKVKSEAHPEPSLVEYPIVSSDYLMVSQQINIMYNVVHWSEITECIKMGYVKVDDYSQKAISRILYRYNRDFD